MAVQAVSFSDVQLATLRIWRATRPFGLSLRIIRNSENSAMAAEVSQPDAAAARWRLEARSDGMIRLIGASGAWVIGSIEAALGNVSRSETERRGAAPQLQGALMAAALRDGLVAAAPGEPA